MKILIIFLCGFINQVTFASCLPVGIVGEFQSASSRSSFAYGTEMIRGTGIALTEQKGRCVKTYEIDINNSISNIEGRIKRYSKEFGVKYFIGLGTSAQVYASLKGINETNSVLLSPTATDDDILAKSRNVILLSPTNKEMLRAAIGEIVKLDYKKASIIFGINDIYSRSMAREFKSLAEARGIQVIFEKGIRTGRNTKIDNLDVASLNASDFLFLPVFELDVIKVLGYLHSKGFKKRVIGTDSWGSNSTIVKTLTPAVVKQLLFSTTGYVPNSQKVTSTPFYKSYQHRYQQEPMDMSAFSYEAMKLVLELNTKCPGQTDVNQCLASLKMISSTTGEMFFDPELRVFKRDIFVRTYE